MVEETFKKLGFTINNETVESSGSDTDWHYYTLDIGDICIMSNASDEVEDDCDMEHVRSRACNAYIE